MASMDNSKKKSQILAADLRDEFNHQANILDEHSKNVNYARVGGGIVGAAGTAAFFVFGAASALATGGLSLAISASAIGGLVSAGAKLTETIIEMEVMKPLAKKWEKFCNTLKAESHPFERREKAPRVLAAFAQGGIETTRLLMAQELRQTGNAACNNGMKLTKAFSRGMAALNLVSMGLNMYDIIDGLQELEKTKQSKAADILRKLATSLDRYAQTGEWSM